jgi:hypothetical protein
MGREIILDDVIKDETIASFYKERTSKLNDKCIVPLEALIECSNEISNECETYAHSLY